jgi:hypothetical protein
MRQYSLIIYFTTQHTLTHNVRKLGSVPLKVEPNKIFKKLDLESETEDITKIARNHFEKIIDESSIPHYYAAVIKTDVLEAFVFKSKSDMGDYSVIDYKLFQKKDRAQVMEHAEKMLNEKQTKKYHVPINTDPPIDIEETIIPQLQIGSIARHYDACGHGHIAICLQVFEDEAKVLFLSGVPTWSIKARLISTEEWKTIQSILFGYFRDTKPTYLCLVERMIPTEDLTLISNNLPSTIIERLVSEFHEND